MLKGLKTALELSNITPTFDTKASGCMSSYTFYSKSISNPITLMKQSQNLNSTWNDIKESLMFDSLKETFVPEYREKRLQISQNVTDGVVTFDITTGDYFNKTVLASVPYREFMEFFDNVNLTIKEKFDIILQEFDVDNSLEKITELYNKYKGLNDETNATTSV